MEIKGYKMNKKMLSKILIPSAIIIVLLIGLGVYLNKIQCMFTPSYSQRQIVSKYFDNVYNNKLKTAYTLLSPKLQAQENFNYFVEHNTPIINNSNHTVVGAYKIVENVDVITGSLIDKKHGTSYNYSVILDNKTNKINYILVSPN